MPPIRACLHSAVSCLIKKLWTNCPPIVGALLAPALFISWPVSLWADTAGMATVDHARFTVVTPTLIRLEYAPDGKFVDLPSWFAVERAARDDKAEIVPRDKGVGIRTSCLRLDYQDDGKPFSAENLCVTIKKGDGEVVWQPGLATTGNLGGTISTLDMKRGPVPLGDGLLSRQGWFLLDDSHSALFSGNWITTRIERGNLDWYLFGYGDDYRAAFQSFTAMGGKVPLPRKYTLGVWYSRYWSYTADDFKQIVKEYEDHGYPLDVLVMDMDWHPVETTLPNIGRGYANLVWTGYTWNKDLIPDPAGLLRWMHDRGIAVTLNDHPADGIQPTEANYADYMHAVGRNPATDDKIPFDAGSKNYLDTFFEFSHLPREKEGVDFWWLDWQQDVHTRSLPGVTNLQILNYYYYQHSLRDGLRGQSFSRWAGWGDHRYPIHFSGDSYTNWEMLAFEVPFTSTSGNVGCFFWSHDIGGHQGGRNEESYARWCQFGALTAALRSHSTRNAEMDRRPWTYPDWAEKSMRRSFRLHAELMPYLYTSMWQATENAIPFLRSLYIDHPREEAAYHHGQEYQFGDNLLVAPVAQPGVGDRRTAAQNIWFPAGDWYDFFTGERFTGPSEAVTVNSIDTFPLFVRGGVPLPMQPFTAHPGTAPLTDLILRCYPGRDGESASSTVYEDDGLTTGYEQGACATTRLTYRRHGDEVEIRADGARGTFHGQPETRRCVVELPGTARLTTCSQPAARTSYDEEICTNRIELPEASVRQGWTLTVRASPVDPATMIRTATARRLRDILGEPYKAWHARGEPASQPVQTLLDAAGGVALVPQHQQPYLYGTQSTLLFCHNHQSNPEEASVQVGADPAFVASLHPGAPVPGLPSTEGLAVGMLPVSVKLADGAILHSTIRATLKPAQDLAAAATVETSTGDGREATRPVRDIDPADSPHEWVTDRQKEGAWLKLTWPQPVEITAVYLFDRPNLADYILGGSLEFDDGTKVDVPALDNAGRSPTTITFPAKMVRALKFTVQHAGPDTQNIGLAKIAVAGKMN